MSLTDKEIRNLESKEKEYKKSDGDGLHILVKPNGSKYWRLSFRVKENGKPKQKTLALGVYPEVSLKQARQKRSEALSQLAQGIDPCAKRKAEKSVDNPPDTFEVVAREWFEIQKPLWGDKHRRNVIQRLEKNVFPFIGNSPIGEVELNDVLSMLRGIEARGTNETAHRVKGICSQVFRYAIVTDRIKNDPCANLTRALAPVIVQHYPTITEPEKVAQLMRAINSHEAHYTVKYALRLLPLVFNRQGELRKATWSEIDFKSGLWTLSGAKRMKTGDDLIVPLSKQALVLFEEVKSIRELQGNLQPNEFIFHSIRSHNRPISDATLGTALKLLGYNNTQIVPHGFRSMARTLLEELLGFPGHWIEMQLAHRVPDTTGRAYNRTALLEQRQFMMQIWADWLSWIAENGYSSDDLTVFRSCVKRYLYSEVS